jgi:uncharacterized protein YcfJ
MTTARTALGLLVPLSLGACAVAPPAGPSVLALPSKGKDLQTFQAEDANCRNYASAQIGNGTPQQAANQAAVGSAAVGTALGAAAGALIGSAGGAVGAGAAIGAGAGLLGGSAVGAGSAQNSAYGLQQRYDMAYTQCIASTGNSVQAPPAPALAYGVPAYAYPAYPYPAYGYPYPYYGYGPGYWGPSVSFGVYRGWGGWHGRRW